MYRRSWGRAAAIHLGLFLVAAVSLAPAQTRKRPAAAAAAVKKLGAKNPAAAKSAPAQKFPIESVRATGSKRYAEAAILAVAALKAGEPLDERKLETARDNLLVHGAFSNVSYRWDPSPSQQGYVVTFEVMDFEQLFPYRFERFDVEEGRLRTALRAKDPLLAETMPGGEPVLGRHRGVLADFLRSQARPAEVQARVVADGADTYILFSPPGLLPAIATVTFTGNKVMTLTQLQNAIHPVAVGVPYREVRFRELLESSVRPLYDARGRLRARFGAIKTEPSTAVKGLALSVAVEEGESYSFGGVTVTGVPGIEEELAKAAAIATDGVADLTTLPASEERVNRVLRRNGHMAVATVIDRKLRDEDRRCDLVFRVSPGPKYTFGRLLFQGLDLHGEHEMKRIWTMKQGAPYNAEYPEFFLNKVKEEQLFDGLENARAVTIPDDKQLTVDVRLVFNEKRAKPVQ